MPNGEERCAWCEKSVREVERLIEGHGCYICDECVEVCATIVKDERSKKRAKAELAVLERAQDFISKIARGGTHPGDMSPATMRRGLRDVLARVAMVPEGERLERIQYLMEQLQD